MRGTSQCTPGNWPPSSHPSVPSAPTAVLPLFPVYHSVHSLGTQQQSQCSQFPPVLPVSLTLPPCIPSTPPQCFPCPHFTPAPPPSAPIAQLSVCPPARGPHLLVRPLLLGHHSCLQGQFVPPSPPAHLRGGRDTTATVTHGPGARRDGQPGCPQRGPPIPARFGDDVPLGSEQRRYHGGAPGTCPPAP